MPNSTFIPRTQSEIEQRLREKVRELELEIHALCNPHDAPAEKWPVVLYFKTREDQEGFISDVKKTFPYLRVRKI